MASIPKDTGRGATRHAGLGHIAPATRRGAEPPQGLAYTVFYIFANRSA